MPGISTLLLRSLPPCPRCPPPRTTPHLSSLLCPQVKLIQRLRECLRLSRPPQPGDEDEDSDAEEAEFRRLLRQQVNQP